MPDNIIDDMIAQLISDAKADAKSLDELVNDPPKIVTARSGREYSNISKVVEDIDTRADAAIAEKIDDVQQAFADVYVARDSAEASATEAATSETNAASSAVVAEQARDQAILAVPTFYGTVEAGLAAVAEDAFFTAPSPDTSGYVTRYQKVSGDAVPKSTLASDLITKENSVLATENAKITALLNTPESLIQDFFLGEIVTGYLRTDGRLNANSANWRTTEFIRAKPGQSFAYESNLGGTAPGPVGFVCAFDSNKALISVVLPVAGFGVKIVEMPANTAFVRASIAVTATPYYFKGYDLSRDDDIVFPELPEFTISALAPDVAYAKLGETLYMYSEGIIADDSVSRAWSRRETNGKVFAITPDSTSDIPVKLKAYDALGTEQTVADFNIKVTGTPVSPAIAQNVICIGDSLTKGVSNSNIQGAYVNEFSRRLTGIGTELLTGSVSPAPLSLSNIFFRGTLGNQAVKHEGRNGWTADAYLTRDESPFMFSGSFDFGQYLTSNGFDDGSVATGVNSTGSNLTCYILLGWNDVYNSGAAFSAGKMTELINNIKATRPDTKFVLVGLNPAPTVNFKFYGGERFVSKRRVFEDSVIAFGEAWKGIAASLTNVDFLQISHVMNAEQSYQTTSKRISARSEETVSGATDHVHPGKTGYCFIADACYYKFLYDECR